MKLGARDGWQNSMQRRCRLGTSGKGQPQQCLTIPVAGDLGVHHGRIEAALSEMAWVRDLKPDWIARVSARMSFKGSTQSQPRRQPVAVQIVGSTLLVLWQGKLPGEYRHIHPTRSDGAAHLIDDHRVLEGFDAAAPKNGMLLPIMALRGCHELDAAMAVFRVVPSHEAQHPLTGLLDRCKRLLWVRWCVFQFMGEPLSACNTSASWRTP